jgi:phage-related protein
LKSFPAEVRRVMGFALRQAQGGDKHINAKPLKGFVGAGVLEVVEDHDGNTYRAVYTVRFSEAVYVLHAFQKKAKRGIATPQRDLDLVRQRLARAQEAHEAWLREQSGVKRT